MIPVGMHEGRGAVSLQWGEVVAVYREDSARGARWTCDVRVTTGAPVERCLIVGDRLPLVNQPNRPSWGVVGYIGSNAHDPVFWPCPWTSETDPEIVSHDKLDRHEFFTFHIENQRGEVTPEAPNGTNADAFGVYTIRAPGNAPPNEDNGPAHRYLQIVSRPRSGGGSGKVQLMGGSRRMARAQADGAAGDYVAISASTSPNFAAWLAWAHGVLTAAATDLGLPPFPGAVGGDGAPAGDPVPAVDGGAAGEAPAGAQLVGAIITGSQVVTGA